MATIAIVFVFVLFWIVISYGAFKVGNVQPRDRK